MTLSRCSIHTFAIAGPAARAAVLFVLRDEHGISGVGEAAPLPGFSPETLESTVDALRAFHPPASLDESLPPLEAVARVLEPYASLLATTPTARFALETALLDLLARRRGVGVATSLRLSGAGDSSRAGVVFRSQEHTSEGCPPPVALGPFGARAPAPPKSPASPAQGGDQGWALHDSEPIEASALILSAADPVTLVEAARAAIARGFRTIKVKLRATDDASLEREIEALLALRRAAPDVALRLDPNGRWTIAEARRYLDRLACVAPDFVEQPVPALALADLGPCAVPWAADESLGIPTIAARLRRESGCAAFILKPAALGIAGALEAARAARERGLGVVVTHFMDGPVGLAAACELALALDPPPLPCGLDPHAGLAGLGPELLPHHDRPACVAPRSRFGLGLSDEAIAALLASSSLGGAR